MDKKTQEKVILRQQLLKDRKQLTIEHVHQWSEAIARQVIALVSSLECNKLALYASYRNEVDTRYLFADAVACGMLVYYPSVCIEGKSMDFYQVTSMHEMREGYQGILEPVPDRDKRLIPDDKTCMVLPGLAFDDKGGRLGYGGGYYDRYLQAHAIRNTIGVAYSFQVVPKVPMYEQDIPIHYLVTEDQIWNTQTTN